MYAFNMNSSAIFILVTLLWAVLYIIAQESYKESPGDTISSY